MPRPRTLVTLFLLVLFTLPATAAERPQPIGSDQALVTGRTAGTVTAEVDTFYLLGGADRWDGRFEDQSGMPQWHGWTHEDGTAQDGLYWQTSTFQALNGQYSMWCGTEFPSGDRGYDNDWRQSLVFTHQVADNAAASTVVWEADLRIDVEPYYDWVYLQVNRGGTWETLQEYDGERVVRVGETIDIQPGDYVGDDQDEIQLRVRVISDVIWSDGDGLWDTDGACQYDDVSVTVDGAQVDFEDFEDQVSNRWLAVDEGGVGDFTGLWTSLMDLDPCFDNYSTQVAFIDDGYVVPGTGGTWCITWCYGPGGYIVNNSGGLIGPETHLDNRVISPVLDWPGTADAAYFQFEVFKHEPLTENSAGIFYQWEVRSVATGDPADLAQAPWRNRNFVYYGGPAYVRQRENLTNLLVSGVTHLQVALRVHEIGWQWSEGWNGDDGTPAPYFDNVQVVAYGSAGPSLTASGLELFNDGFPATGEIDYQDLSRNSVRLDMARNISPHDHLRNDPGDSLVFEAATIRAGAHMLEPPRLHLRLKANPMFRDMRVLPPGFTLLQDGAGDADLVVGVVVADTVRYQGYPVENHWSCDLPDSGFFYPGDVMHYYLRAQDIVLGDVGTAILPADTTGFASFSPFHRYDDLFTVRALPSLFSDHPGDQPTILLWHDHGDQEIQDRWWGMFDALGRRVGYHYDMFCTNTPSAGAGNGLGGRATADVLAGYDIILHGAGDQISFVLGDGDYDRDPSDDIGVLSDWLQQGGRHLFLSGDNVAFDLANSGPAGAQFLADEVGVAHVAYSLRELIGNQTTPLVTTFPGNGVLWQADRWIAYGGCPSINAFDAVTPLAGTVALAEFTDPSGSGGVYPYAAATLHTHPVHDGDVVLLPHDIGFVYTSPDWTPPPGHPTWSVRAAMLDDLLAFFDYLVWPPPGVTPEAMLQVSHYPNPFNPATTIALDLPRAVDVRLRIYDLRGALIRTLVDERLKAGRHELVWDGTDGRGATLASGVYFAETRAGDEVRVHKLALVK